VTSRRQPDVVLAIEPADSETSVALQEAFFADIAGRYPGWNPTSSQSVEPAELAPPDGVWLVAYVDGQAVGCGGLQRLDAEVAEIRRIYLADRARGRGIGGSLLAKLEEHAVTLNYERVRLTTGDRQLEALGLFQSRGYAEIEPFTDGSFTTHWMEKQLS
jgi:GNAT superfamily N-acetyltransferase